VALLLLLGTAFYFGRGFFQNFRAKSHPPNAFYQVKRADMLISVTEEGALRALNETVIRSGLEGFNRIIHLVPEGSYVQKDELLVELDSSGLRDRLNEQELLYQERLFMMLQAKGNLEIQKSLAESQIKDAELRVENAQSDLEKYRDGDAPLLIKTVEARSAVLAEQVRIATERHTRTEELFKTGKATRSELEADALSLKREQLGFNQYQEDLRLIKKYDQPNQIRLLQSQLDQAQAELDRLRQRTSNEIAQAAADLKTSQAGLEFLEDSLESQKRRLESSKIYAPQNGLVVYASVSPFQSYGDEGRRDEGRFRGGRGDRQGGDREFRGGGRRGGSGMSSSGNGGGGTSGGSVAAVSSTAETVAAGNQRIASAVSGTSATELGSGGGQSSGNSLGGSSGGGRSSGGGGGGGGGGSQGTASAAGAFASYSSMRPSSAFAYSGASSTAQSGNGGNTASSSSGGTSSAQGSTGGERSAFSTGNQFSTMRSMSQSFGYGGFESFGNPGGILQEGVMVRQRQELIRLPDVSKMLAEVKINESRVSQIRAGMPAYIRVNTIPHRQFKGTVRRVAPLPDAQASWMTPNVKVYPTDILVDEELPLLKPGVSATAEIIITNLTRVLSVPIQAVTRLRGENVCFTKRGSRVLPVPVATGWFNDAFIEITAGLKDGDLVLLAPVGDEETEEKPDEDTNQVNAIDESSVVPPSQVPPPLDEPFSDERRMRRRDSDSTNGGGAFQERGRFRQGPGGRRSQNSSDGPE
jgi:multidrug resistance efflux pump